MTVRIIPLLLLLLTLWCVSAPGAWPNAAQPAPPQPTQYVLETGEVTTGTPPPSYIIGPGDVLHVTLRAFEVEENSVTVDDAGAIILPALGEVSVGGKQLGEVRGLLQQAYSRIYQQPQVSCVPTFLRTFRVPLQGQVNYPGTYTVTPLVTAVDLVVRSGDTSPAGTRRQVLLYRADGSAKTVDLDRVLLLGDASSDCALEVGDRVFVPFSGPRVSITGAVPRPDLYELKGQEGLAALLEFAGGATADAALDKAYLDRYLEAGAPPHRIPLRLEQRLKNGALVEDVPLQNDDTVVVPPVSNYVGTVEARGRYRKPGWFPWRQGMTVKDVVDLAHGLNDGAWLERAYLLRYDQAGRVVRLDLDMRRALQPGNAVEFPVLEGDVITVPDIAQQFAAVDIRGAVPDPGTRPFWQGMRLGDLVMLAGGLLPIADLKSARLLRMTPGGAYRFVPADFTAALTRLEAESNAPLEPGDVISIPSVTAARGRVRITGEVNVLRHPTITAEAPPETAPAATETVAPVKEEVAVGAERIKSAHPVWEPQPLVDFTAEPYFEDTLKEGETLTDLIAVAQGLTAQAAKEHCRIERVSPAGGKEMIEVNLLEVYAGKAADPPLRDGDLVWVPPVSLFQDTVRVVGEVVGKGLLVPPKAEASIITAAEAPRAPVTVQGLYLLRHGETARDLIEAVGGFTALADLPNCRVERQTKEGARQVLPVDLYAIFVDHDLGTNVTLQNGDVVVVPRLRDQVYVVGEVNRPGAYDYAPGRRLTDYVGLAGGGTQRAHGKSTVIARLVAGQTESVPVNLSAAMGGTLDQNPELLPGDVVIVPERELAGWRDYLQAATGIATLWLFATR